MVNKFRLCINNCRSEINSLLDRIRGKEITHTFVTVDGDKIKCIDSIELYSDETKIIIAKCQIGLKTSLVTINEENIRYTIEDFDDEVWKTLRNMPTNFETNETDDRLYM